MSENESELEGQKVRLKSDGRLVQRIDGTENLVATYSRTTGHLEFETREASVKLHQQCVDRISTVNKGTQPSGMTVKSVGIKGVARTAPATKKPKMGREGDGTPALVDWYVRHNLSEAIIRYGIYCDANGKPIRKQVQRIVESMVDGRDEPAEPTPTPRPGQSFEGGPIRREKRIISVRGAIIARRATRYEDNEDVLAELGVEKLEALFTPNEVVNGFQPDEDFEDAVVAQEAE